MDYTANPDINNVGDGLDMDMVHDFGEGVGLDMRDFPVHEVDDLEDKHLGRSARPRPTGRLSFERRSTRKTLGQGTERVRR
jgi:hypothetical protein